MKKFTLQLLSLLVLGSMILAACAPATTAPPVTTQPPAITVPTAVPPTKAPPTAIPPTTVPPTTVPPTTAPTVPPAATVPNCGTDPVVLKATFETGFPVPQQLADEFTKQFPNVTWDISSDQFANLITTTPLALASDNPPD